MQGRKLNDEEWVSNGLCHIFVIQITLRCQKQGRILVVLLRRIEASVLIEPICSNTGKGKGAY